MGRRIYADFTIQGRAFKTVSEAAKHFGVVELTVQRALRSGNTHRLGTGRTGVEPFPVRIRGKTYPSMAVAAKKLGVTVSAVSQALMMGRIDRVGLPWSHRPPTRTKSVTIGSLTFNSLADADRALGFAVGYISHSMKNRRKSAMERIMAAAMAKAVAGEIAIAAE